MVEAIARLNSKFGRDHTRLGWTTATAFGVLPSILCVLGVMLFHDVNLQLQLTDNLRAYNSQYEQFRRVYSLLQDAETGQRGYLLTEEQDYLKRYTEATRSVPKLLFALQSQSGGAGADQSGVATLVRLSRNELSDLAQAVRLGRDGQMRLPLHGGQSNRGNSHMDQIRSLMAQVEARYGRAAAAQRRAIDATSRRTMGAGIGLGLFFLLALAVTGRIIFTAVRHRRRLFKSLEEVAVRQSAVLSSAADAIITLTSSGTIESINRAGERMFGYEAAALISRDIRVLLDLGGASTGTVFDGLGSTPDQGLHPVTREGVGVHQNGDRFPVDVALGPMELDAGSYGVAIVRDISERKRAEEIKDQFIAVVSHELRTPLTSITGSLGLLNGGAVQGLPDGARRLISIAYANSDRLGRLVNDILDLEKIQCGRMPFASDPFDLTVVLRRTVEEMDSYANKYDVKILLPETDQPIWALGDAERIAQVAANLISNAVKVSSKGGVVRIGFGRREGSVQVSVSDNGPGIPEAFQSRIFTRFAQVESSDSPQRGGTGLGLAICKEIIDRQGGRLFFKTAPGKGTRFFVTLPACGPPQAAADRGSAQALTPEPPCALICEDDLEMCETLTALAKREGLQTDLVHSLNQARVALAQGAHACAFIDLKLPDGSGLEILKSLKTPSGPPLPVVIVSVEERPFLPAMPSGLQVVDWVQKPLTPWRIRQSLQRALEVAKKNATADQPMILHVEDDTDVLSLVADLLKTQGDVVCAKTVASAKHALAIAQPELVILDIGLADGSGLSLLPFLTDSQGKRIPTIVFTGQDGQPAAGRVDAVLTKSRVSLERLATEVDRLLHTTPSRKVA